MNTIHSILYATDFSAQSEAALPLAISLARDYGARLIVIHVMPEQTVVYAMGNEAIIEPERNAAEVRDRLEQFDPRDSHIEVEYLIEHGEPATEILDAARKTSCDLIVMGTHGRTGVSRLLVGSVAEQVLRHAQCPVLTIRSKAIPSSPAPIRMVASFKTPEEAFTMAPYLP